MKVWYGLNYSLFSAHEQKPIYYVVGQDPPSDVITDIYQNNLDTISTRKLMSRQSNQFGSTVTRIKLNEMEDSRKVGLTNF